MTDSPLEQLTQLADQISPVSLPGCYQRPEFRFCKVGYDKSWLNREIGRIKAISDAEKALQDAESALKNFKIPRGKQWQRAKTETDGPEVEGWLSHTDDRLLSWIRAGGNYGIVAGSEWQHEGQAVRLCLIDADEVTAWQDAGFFDDLPKQTRTVQSSQENKRHFYFITDLESTKAHEELPGLGHFKFYASQVVGPGSLHPSGIRYILIDESAPAFVDAETLASACIAATKALMPSKLDLVMDMVGVKPNHAGRLKENADLLNDKLKQAKVDRIKKIQQQEAQTEAAYNAVKSKISAQADAKDQDKPDVAGIEPLNALISAINKDERINLCLRRFNAGIPKLHRFVQAAGHVEKTGKGEHFLRRAWAVALSKSGYLDCQMHLIAQFFDDYTTSRTQQEFDSVKRWVTEKNGNFYPCKEIRGYIATELCQGCSWSPPEQADQDPGQDTTAQAQDPEISAKAEEIINSGKFIDTWKEVYSRRHNGDSHIAVAMAGANLTANIVNSHGIAVLQVAGGSGDGKSHAVQTAAQQMGRWCDISGLSPMALLYHAGETVNGGMMVVLDDNRPDDRQADIIKRAQTQFKTGYKYKTIIKGKPITLQMPPGVQLLTTQVDADSEDQVLNRTLLLEVEGNLNKDLKIIEADLRSLETGEQPLDDPDITLCQVAFDMLKAKTYVVTIPDAKRRIKWQERSKDERANLRNFNIFRDLMLAYAVMRWPQRPHREEDRVLHIEATRQDFMDALALYHTVHRQMKTKLTNKEIEVLNFIKKNGGRVSREDAMKGLNLSPVRLTQLVRGEAGQGGLRAKVPGFYTEEAQESKGIAAEGYYDPKVRKRYLCLSDTNVYQAELSTDQTQLTFMAATWTDD